MAGSGGDEDETHSVERRRLRGDGTRGLSLADRLNQRLHRLAWRSPIHSMRLSGRYPLQLIDVPADPIPGRPKAGRALMDGAMLFGQERVPIDSLKRGGHSAGFAEYRHSFGWLRDLAAAASREEGAPVAEAIARTWLAEHARTVADPAWRPDLWGRRILLWTAYAPYLLSSGDEELRKTLLNTLARGARHLDRAADSVPQGVARIAAWSGVIAAGLLIPGGDLRTAHGEAGLARALTQALHEDGGLATRVPAMQLDLIELLAQLRAVYEVRARPMPAAVSGALAKAVPALIGVVLGDGGLSSWQGGGPGSAHAIAAAVAASGVRAEALSPARDWGYQRLEAGASRLVMDAAPPPSGALIRGGCASTLAFELSEGAQRLIVNCGGAPGLPGELAQGLRTTAAHSTLTLAETNSTALHEDGSLGRGVGEVDLERSEARDGMTLVASHDGYVRRHGFRHERSLTLSADGRTLSGDDRLVPAGRRRGLAATPFVIRFHLAPALETVLTADAHGALIRPPEGGAWQFRAESGTLTMESSVWIDPLGRPRAAHALAITSETPPDGAAIGWSLRRVR
ncbi:heparinase II/III family protein [Sphingomonas sp. BIUV-7]|uniref:Heparinase II/III family protein n=1 Tax=Sphingomonas natans TaxID=3063330 RepID=A0ABT8Y453_9SPHN|nr:heparinase II/III family protein [Sphingomonas sp. BIUV-7]MDO6413089.1 heparinase II/III family protein [Sphingomonas sp. BIUV-7]